MYLIKGADNFAALNTLWLVEVFNRNSFLHILFQLCLQYSQ